VSDSTPRAAREDSTEFAFLKIVTLLALILVTTPSLAVAQAAPVEGCPPGLEVLVERAFADSRGFNVGDDFSLRADPDGQSCVARVAGLFDPPADPSSLTVERPRVLFHLPQLAALTGRNDEVDQFTLRVATGADPQQVARDLEPFLPGTQVLTTSEVANRTSTTFMVVSRFHRAIGVITLIAGGVFLACIMILKVQERRAPVAAAQLVGIPRRTLLGWTVAEAALVSVLGGVFGLGLGMVASSIINAFYQRAYQTKLVFSHVTGEMVLLALALAVVLGMAAGVFAGVRLLSANALEEVGR
jgi:putative ABC transport system permease protein